jgi:hypothetical protein
MEGRKCSFLWETESSMIKTDDRDGRRKKGEERRSGKEKGRDLC